MERSPRCALMIAVECVITARSLHPNNCVTLLGHHAPPHSPSCVIQWFCPSSSPLSLNSPRTRSHACRNTICFLLPAADQTTPIALTVRPLRRQEAVFQDPSSAIVHFLPPWRMPLTACKLIYNAVSPPRWVEGGWVGERGGGLSPVSAER